MASLSRRQLMLAFASGASAEFLARKVLAQERSAASTTSSTKPATPAAIERGLKWLAKQQTDDGSFGSVGFPKNVAVCSLAGLAFLASGSTPDRGPYGKVLNKIVRYVLASADESGFLCRPAFTSHGPMYDHGFATLFLAEVHGMLASDAAREPLRKAVRIIVGSQNDEGGWRYQPDGREADISVTISQVMALRAARNAGVYVPAQTIDRCIDYVKRCQNADGGFMYMVTGGPSRFPRSAAGVVALFSAGIYEGPEVERGLEYLRKHPPEAKEFGGDTHTMYGQYYGAQAMWLAGEEHWRKWFPLIQDVLLAKQQKDGAWPDIICNEYGTAMACIILQLPNNYLPIFQR